MGLIEIPCQFGFEEEPSDTDLHKAVRSKNVNLVEKVISKGANINAKGEDYLTPLELASKLGFTEIVCTLLKYDADSSYRFHPPLHQAVRGGKKNLDVIRLLIESGVNLEAKNSVGSTALMDAINFGHTKIVKLLVENGADINTRDSDDWTPLMSAVSTGRIDLVEFLIEKNADINAVNMDKHSALDIAYQNRRKKIISLLMKYLES